MEKKKYGSGKRKRKRKRSGNRWQRIALIAFLALLCVLFVLGCGQRWAEYESVSKEISAAESALAAAKANRAALAATRALLGDKSYLTILAREKLGYICRGEMIYLPASVVPETLPSVNTRGVIAE